MIVWLASYPRSGNTALRVLLHSAFGLPTHSLYDDLLDIAPNAGVRDAVGHVNHGLSPRAFTARAAAAPDTVLVKTHGPPEDASRAIYVVRDGRSASVSYLHWIERYLPQTPVSLTDVVAGRVTFGSWSAHIEAWAPRTRPDTLLLSYEEVIAPTPDTIAALAGFIGATPLADYTVPSFGDLNTREPGFFRAGSDARNIAELTGDDLDLFWWLHGQAMVDFGYATTIPAPGPGWSARRAFLEAAQHGQALRADLGAARRRLSTTEADLAAQTERLAQVEADLATQTERLARDEAALAARSAEADRLRRRLADLTDSSLLRMGDRLGISRALRNIRAELAVPPEGPADRDGPG